MNRFDLLVLAPGGGTGPTLITTDSVADPVILGANGIYSLVGQVVRTLLTSKGSWPGRPSEGTSLTETVGSNFDLSSFRALAARSVISVEDTIKKKQVASNCPLDEMLLSLEIEDITVITPDHVSIRIAIRSVSGQYAIVTTEV